MEMKCSLLIQQLIYPSYDYFKHKTKNNETRCNCFLEDFLYLLFRTRLIRSPHYFEGRSNALGFTLPFYASPVISKPRYFELVFISLWTSKQRGSTVSVILHFQLKRAFFKYSYKTLGFCHFAALFYTLFPKKLKGNCS